MNKVAKYSAALVALLLIVTGVAINRSLLLSADDLTVSLDVTVDADFISNDPAADNEVVIVITDGDRSASTSTADTIPGSAITILNVQTNENITTTAAEVASAATTTSAVHSGIFRATFTVTSTTSTGSAIQAADGEQIRVSYTTLGGSTFSARTPTSAPTVNEIEVDATGPVITGASPADATESKDSTQTFQADITDARSGIGTTDAAVRSRLTFTIGAENLPLTLAAIDADSTQWRAQVQNTFLTAGTKT